MICDGDKLLSFDFFWCSCGGEKIISWRASSSFLGVKAMWTVQTTNTNLPLAHQSARCTLSTLEFNEERNISEREREQSVYIGGSDHDVAPSACNFARFVRGGERGWMISFVLTISGFSLSFAHPNHRF